MAKKFKNIYLHIGPMKTGSSYIQSALDKIESLGAFKDTAYPQPTNVAPSPIDDPFFIRSGNGLEIATTLVWGRGGRSPSPPFFPVFDRDEMCKRLNDLLDGISEDKSNLLISSEWLSAVVPERFVHLKHELEKLTDNIVVLAIVRPLGPWSFSCYNQQVKRHGSSISFEEWANRELVPTVRLAIKTIIDLDIPTIFIPYRKSGLLEVFLNEINESESAELFDDIKVNRGLSFEETNLLKITNSIFKDDGLSAAISDLLIKTNPNIASQPKLDETADIVKKHLPAITTYFDSVDNPLADSFRELFLADEDVLEESINASAVESNTAQSQELFPLFLEAIYARLTSGELPQLALLNYMVNVAPLLCPKLEPSQEFFDPVHYLLLNPDVLAAGLDPAEHYKTSGMAEERFSCYLFNGVYPPPLTT